MCGAFVGKKESDNREFLPNVFTTKFTTEQVMRTLTSQNFILTSDFLLQNPKKWVQ